ncbi:hypothetical protein A8F94_14075 [Bacillus sp. FJAT-27225]|uniref:Gfo/Idh/MocA family protein n=1 Tax=Bacillus sp. FJAT-27225 TaxID=1743144 RepID=UPI00080C2AF2|nr:Gfo/Idh/MocA family oxidoreductase [Bacillus sp. FJAT-27225]OCA85970.1 hypothetical protein A8F94_14075 [Bacillus sp. FJAT-27225]
MAEQKIGVGIIGCGAVSMAHVKAYLELEKDCTIRAVADIQPGSAEKLAGEIPGHIDMYDDIGSLLKREDIGVVSICTPPFLHKEQVIEALSKGKHVICEKPFAPSLADCDAMIDAAVHFNRKLCVTLQLRFGEDFKRVRHIVKSGMLGEIVFAQMQGLYWRGDAYYKKDWRGTWEKEGGGILMTQAIHPLDLLLDLLGGVKSVKAEMDTISHHVEVEDFITAVIEFEAGVRVHILATINSVNNGVKISLSGKTKAIEWPMAFHAVSETPGGFPVLDHEGFQALKMKGEEIPAGRDDHFAPISDMISAIKNNREPVVNGVEARKSIELVTGIYKSASINQSVTFPVDKNDPWYSKEGILSHIKRNVVT